ncbi:hypothetical protein BJY04DRAFT_215872 [Aspergillus karnatakaensis]|uniref:uncharacterized protein n=1 Tax=Aspergillus karnatakaensis TaxID=1810916 RepID=UPI003CCCA8AC
MSPHINPHIHISSTPLLHLTLHPPTSLQTSSHPPKQITAQEYAETERLFYEILPQYLPPPSPGFFEEISAHRVRFHNHCRYYRVSWSEEVYHFLRQVRSVLRVDMEGETGGRSVINVSGQSLNRSLSHSHFHSHSQEQSRSQRQTQVLSGFQDPAWIEGARQRVADLAQAQAQSRAQARARSQALAHTQTQSHAQTQAQTQTQPPSQPRAQPHHQRQQHTQGPVHEEAQTQAPARPRSRPENDIQAHIQSQTEAQAQEQTGWMIRMRDAERLRVLGRRTEVAGSPAVLDQDAERVRRYYNDAVQDEGANDHYDDDSDTEDDEHGNMYEEYEIQHQRYLDEVGLGSNPRPTWSVDERRVVERRKVDGDCMICLSPLEDNSFRAPSRDSDNSALPGDQTQCELHHYQLDCLEDDGMVWCKAFCGVNYHKECFKGWALVFQEMRNEEKRFGPVTCPACRRAWRRYELDC